MILTVKQRDWLALTHIRGLGPVGIHKLFNRFHSIERILAADYGTLLSAGVGENVAKAISRLPDTQTSDRFKRYCVRLSDWLADSNNHLVSLEDTVYPQLLRETAAPPPLLYAKGNVSALSQISIAVVGSRMATPQGLRNAFDISEQMWRRGLVVVSGLAKGVDAAAHRGALSVKGVTVAVLGTGVDVVYPRGHDALAQEILECKGVIVSEMPLGTSPKAANFPRRNRIISGLSKGLLVVEAGLNSGSLISARYALEQDREVFAMPGSIMNPQSKGCHALIKQGAKLVENAEDIAEELRLQLLQTASEHQVEMAHANIGVDNEARDLASSHRVVLAAMGWDIVCVDHICEETGLDGGVVSMILMELELMGLVSADAGGYQRINPVKSMA